MKKVGWLNKFFNGKVFILFLFVFIFLIASVLGSIGDSGYSGIQVENYFAGSGKQGITQNISFNDSEGNNHFLIFEDGLMVNYTKTSAPEQSPFLSGIVAYYKLDEGSGAVIDSTENEHVGTNNGATRNVSGKINTAYDFDGVNDYININDSDALDPVYEISIQAWVYRNSTTGGHVSVADKASDAALSYFLYIRDDGTPRLTFAINKGGTGDGAQAQESASFPTGQWVHVVGTYDGETIRLYRNGISVSNTTYSSTISSSSNPLYISKQGAGQYWNGKVDEVGIWNRTLNSTEITELYNGGSGLSFI